MKKLLVALLTIASLSGCHTTPNHQEKVATVNNPSISALNDQAVMSIIDGDSGLYRVKSGSALAFSNVDNMNSISSHNKVIFNYLVGSKRLRASHSKSIFMLGKGKNPVHYIHIEKGEFNQLISNVSKRSDFSSEHLYNYGDSFTALHELSHFYMNEQTHKLYSSFLVSRSEHEAIADVTGLMLLAKYLDMSQTEILNIAKELSELRETAYEITKDKHYDTAYGIRNLINTISKDAKMLNKIKTSSNYHITKYSRGIVSNTFKK